LLLRGKRAQVVDLLGSRDVSEHLERAIELPPLGWPGGFHGKRAIHAPAGLALYELNLECVVSDEELPGMRADDDGAARRLQPHERVALRDRVARGLPNRVVERVIPWPRSRPAVEENCPRGEQARLRSVASRGHRAEGAVLAPHPEGEVDETDGHLGIVGD